MSSKLALHSITHSSHCYGAATRHEMEYPNAQHAEQYRCHPWRRPSRAPIRAVKSSTVLSRTATPGIDDRIGTRNT